MIISHADWAAVIARRYLIDTLTKPQTAREVLTPAVRRQILTAYLTGTPVSQLVREHHIGQQTIYQITGRYRGIIRRSAECGLMIAIMADILGCSSATLSTFVGVDS